MEYHPAMKMTNADLHMSAWINIQYIELKNLQVASYIIYMKF